MYSLLIFPHFFKILNDHICSDITYGHHMSSAKNQRLGGNSSKSGRISSEHRKSPLYGRIKTNLNKIDRGHESGRISNKIERSSEHRKSPLYGRISNKIERSSEHRKSPLYGRISNKIERSSEHRKSPLYGRIKTNLNKIDRSSEHRKSRLYGGIKTNLNKIDRGKSPLYGRIKTSSKEKHDNQLIQKDNQLIQDDNQLIQDDNQQCEHKKNFSCYHSEQIVIVNGKKEHNRRNMCKCYDCGLEF